MCDLTRVETDYNHDERIWRYLSFELPVPLLQQLAGLEEEGEKKKWKNRAVRGRTVEEWKV